MAFGMDWITEFSEMIGRIVVVLIELEQLSGNWLVI